MDDNMYTTRSFNNNSGNPPRYPNPAYKPVAQPISRMKIDELHAKLSAPRVTRDITPMGEVSRSMRTEQDMKILAEIEENRRRLETRRDAAKEAFQRAHANQTIKRGRKW